MEEIKVGEYARTEEGEIFRVIEQEVDFYNFQIKKLNPKEIFNPIVKHSFNIIDLIEPGDYLDGTRVDIVDKDQDDHVIYAQNYDLPAFDLKDIKSICTKEQFENAEYKLDN